MQPYRRRVIGDVQASMRRTSALAKRCGSSLKSTSTPSGEDHMKPERIRRDVRARVLPKRRIQVFFEDLDLGGRGGDDRDQGRAAPGA